MRSSMAVPLAFLGLACLAASARGDATDDRIRQQEAALKQRDAEIKSLRAKVAELEAELAKLRTAKKGPVRPPATQAATGEERLRRNLEREIERLTFTDIDLKDVLQFLQEYSEANIHVNWHALQAAGIHQTTKVSVNVGKVSVKRVLDLILCEAGAPAAGTDAELRSVVDGGVLIISTRADFLRGSGHQGEKAADDAGPGPNRGQQTARHAPGKQAAEGEIAKALVRSIQALAGTATQKDFDVAESAARLALETLSVNKGFLNAAELAGHRARIEAQLRLIATQRGALGGPKAADAGRSTAGH
ncbi:MAG TPA: hypothetical protein VM031_02080 [Phycisphaerae bacterium]|nr:hypothetical protein [Phycisphaerae bacterium]